MKNTNAKKKPVFLLFSVPKSVAFMNDRSNFSY